MGHSHPALQMHTSTEMPTNTEIPTNTKISSKKESKQIQKNNTHNEHTNKIAPTDKL